MAVADAAGFKRAVLVGQSMTTAAALWAGVWHILLATS